MRALTQRTYHVAMRKSWNTAQVPNAMRDNSFGYTQCFALGRRVNLCTQSRSWSANLPTLLFRAKVDEWNTIVSFCKFTDRRASGPVASLTDAAIGAMAVVKDFSADNTFLFAFLVVTAILVVLMLRT